MKRYTTWLLKYISEERKDKFLLVTRVHENFVPVSSPLEAKDFATRDDAVRFAEYNKFAFRDHQVIPVKVEISVEIVEEG